MSAVSTKLNQLITGLLTTAARKRPVFDDPRREDAAAGTAGDEEVACVHISLARLCRAGFTTRRVPPKGFSDAIVTFRSSFPDLAWRKDIQDFLQNVPVPPASQPQPSTVAVSNCLLRTGAGSGFLFPP